MILLWLVVAVVGYCCFGLVAAAKALDMALRSEGFALTEDEAAALIFFALVWPVSVPMLCLIAFAKQKRNPLRSFIRRYYGASR